MSRLDELIMELCPDGVPHKKLRAVAEYGRNRIDASDVDAHTYVGVDNLLPNKGGKTDSEYVPEEGRLIQFLEGDVLIGNIRPYLKKVWLAEYDGGTNGDVLVVHITDRNLSSEFLYYCLSSDQFFDYDMKFSKGSKMPRGDKSAIMEYSIPIPPIEVQCEVVRMLDTFTELTANLKAELSAELMARKRQYKYYSTQLLDEYKNKINMVCVSELGKWQGGKTPSMDEKSFWENGTIPWISSKDMKAPILKDTQDHITSAALTGASMTLFPADSVAIVTRSGILKHTFPVAYVPFQTTVNQDIKILTVREGVSGRYVSLAMQAYGDDILAKTKKQGGTVDSLDFQKVLNYTIPLPEYDVQMRIVEVLDNFESICSDLSIGLPAEIEARQKQYEFYRDQLLTFAATGNTILTDRQTDRAD